MAEAGTGFVDLVPRADSFVGSLTSQVSSALTQVTANTKGQVSGLARGVQTAFIALGATAVVAITKGISATTEWASQVRSLQRVTGQTAESASALAGAGAILGLNVDQLNIGFGLLAKNIVNGSASLTKYGISTKDASGVTLPFDDVLGNISDKFVSLPPGIEQAAFAQNVFGRSGKALIPILAQGRDGLAALEAKAADLHLVMSQQNLDDAKKLSEAQRELGLAFKGASISIGKDFIPAVTTAVHAVTDIVGVIADIPGPIKIAVLGFSLLTGAVAAVIKVGGFFHDTWEKALDVLSNTAQIDTAATGTTDLANAAETALQQVANLSNIIVATRGSAIAAAVPVGTLDVAMTSEADAALAASLANTNFSRSVSGLIVPTTAATDALAAEASAATAAGASTAGAVGKVGLLAGAIKFLRAQALPLAGGFLLGSIPELPNSEDLDKINSLLGTLQGSIRDAGGASHLTAEQQGFLAQETGFATSALGANAQAFQLALRTGISYSDALAQITARLGSADSSSRQLSQGIRQLLNGVEDSQTPIQDVGFLIDSLVQASGRATVGFGKLSEVSGQDFGTIRDAIVQALTDPKTTVEQLPGIFAGALGKIRETMRAWHDDVVANFGGAQAAISEFLGQAAGAGPDKVSFSNLTKSLQEQRAQLRRWSSDFSTILSESGKRANRFLRDMSANGLDSIGILDVVAQQPKKIRDQFLAQYNDVNKATSDIATQITDAFGKAVDRIVLQLRNIIRAIRGLPPIRPKVDPSQALAALDAIIAKEHQAFQASQGGKGGPVSPRQTFASGGVIRGATGFVTNGPVFQVGERGTELVDPLEGDRAKRLRAQSIADALKILGVSGGQKDMRVHVTVAMDDSGNLQVRKIARDEIDREHDYRARVG